MIRYTLRCEKKHEFEAWFRSSDDYDRAAPDGKVPCPMCGATRVEKAIMAPAVKGAKKDKGGEEKVQLAAVDPRAEALRAAVKELRQKLTESADYVGDRFAEEARKIHYKETEARGIYGEATGDEAKALAEEGVEFHPLPVLPEDRN
ncbi:MAG: DUF1178 family protein [Bauldia sp.]|nr:MAG: DUF1178 family protein [Bauldia sp.]